MRGFSGNDGDPVMNFKGIEKALVQLIKILLYFATVLIMIYLICSIYNWIISWFFNEFKIKDKFMYLFGDMDIKHQIALPFFVGIIGSFSTSLIMLLKGQTDVKITLFNGSLEILNWIVAVITACLLGGIAGVGAVNILNSDGSVTEVLVIALVAGLSGITYLKGIALMSGTEENEIFKARVDEVIDNGQVLLTYGEIPNNEILDSWEDFIQTWVEYYVDQFKNDNPTHTNEEFHAYLIELEELIDRIWKGDEVDG